MLAAKPDSDDTFEENETKALMRMKYNLNLQEHV
jgi:hypothetical protein